LLDSLLQEKLAGQNRRSTKSCKVRIGKRINVIFQQACCPFFLTVRAAREKIFVIKLVM